MVDLGDRIAEYAHKSGFQVVESQKVHEIDGVAYRMVHTKSGAQLLFLQNEDNNKSFSITFKTPAADDTGVFHILEHSVLCGSDKFPVKEPFVDLLKGSMQTFLNAMTFPDKTMYPVASTNDQDLLNLMDVYMDAVFHPLIYKKKAIFEQEGWHFELSDAQPAQLEYNGVVFNEMKGALSDPDSVLYDTLSAALFPDTTYRFESGGIPAAIVDLTYEDFLETHARHYRPDNSYIILYGNVDIERILAFLDLNYLSPLSEVERKVLAPNPIGTQKPVINTNVLRHMVTSPENSCAALGFVAGDFSDREQLIATDILVDALLGSNEAPLKRAILDAQIADDCIAYLEDGIAQPFVMLEIKGLREGAVERFGSILRKSAQALASGGLDHELIEASLSHAEFVMREHNMRYADGVVYSIAVMSGWLYDDDMALDNIRFEAAFASLREKLEHGYFEELISRLFLTNNHYAQVEIVPVQDNEDDVLCEKLQKYQAAMEDDGLQAIANNVASLRLAQQSPDTPEALSTLPRLNISQIGIVPPEPKFELDTSTSIACLRHHIPSHGIAYFYRYFPLDGISFDELPYVGLLSMLLGKLDTSAHTAAEIDLLSQAKLGNLNFFAEVHEHIADNNFSAKFVVSTSALAQNCSYAASIADEVMLHTNFHTYEKLRDILMQKRVAMEQGFASAGNAVASRRAASYYLPAACVREQFSGIDFYRFLKEQIENFEENKETLANKLHEIARRIFTGNNCLLSFNGEDADLDNFLNAHKEFEAQFSDVDSASSETCLRVPNLVDKHEAFIVPSDVSYTALVADRRQVGEYSGVWSVISRVLTYGYLWQEVRVLGGAYGTGFSSTITGLSSFTSYRDPHLDETVQRFKGCASWLAEFAPNEEEFTGFIVSSVAGMDAPLKPRELMRRQDGMYFSGYTPELRARSRCQILECTVEDIRAFSSAMERLCQSGHVCSVGNRDILKSSKLEFELVDLIG
ncbi:insulinase family protein [Adlercreutzia sp. ZJ154]|uniref:insulinase family protein n=1 Tax=Adlercreutzia sp. ZJ154 TaxID=2709790 RepID=UPI0013EDF3FA|nr:insulinase family protein [Adlercreutzia sp. ZJ154]